MPRYIVTLTNDEIQELKALIQKGGKGLPHKACADTAKAGPETRKQGMDI